MPDDNVAPPLPTPAYAVAATTRHQGGVAEVHDFFTAVDPISYEDLGFAEQLGSANSSKTGSHLAAEAQQ